MYKPYAIFDGKRWLLWYNGRKGGVEQIGVALHEGRGTGLLSDGEALPGHSLRGCGPREPPLGKSPE